MLGAIVGDIAGSRFEFGQFKSKAFELLDKGCFFTDDTVLTLAVCEGLLRYNGDVEKLEQQTINFARKFASEYRSCGYGAKFKAWVVSKDPKPYGSFGNGAAMRVSGCGYVADSIEEVKLLSKAVTAITHDHPQAILAAEATAVCVYLAREGRSLEGIRQYVLSHYYKMDFTLDEIRPSYRHEVSCQESVPQALESFFESNSFEDAIRNAVSLGGDSDTIAAIAGSIAEPYYGIPTDIREKALGFLDERLRSVVKRFETHYPPKII